MSCQITFRSTQNQKILKISSKTMVTDSQHIEREGENSKIQKETRGLIDRFHGPLVGYPLWPIPISTGFVFLLFSACLFYPFMTSPEYDDVTPTHALT